jgi:putative hydrolase of the HAD superfamily
MSVGSLPVAATVFVDADNTLWDTDKVFADAQLGMLADVERRLDVMASASDRLGYIRAIDQAIAARHHGGLRYPPRLLVTALGFALRGADAEAAARGARLSNVPSPMSSDAESEVEAAYFTALKAVPALRPGVLEGMTALQDAGCILLIISEAPRARVEATAKAVGLDGHFSRVIEGQKRPELYTRVFRLTALPERAYMIGDQLDRDIAPAKTAGLITIYFPGGFVPRWSPSEAAIGPDFRITNFQEAVGIIVGEDTGSRLRSVLA